MWTIAKVNRNELIGIDIKNKNVLAYERSLDHTNLLIVINFSSKSQNIVLPDTYNNCNLLFSIHATQTSNAILGLDAWILKKK